MTTHLSALIAPLNTNNSDNTNIFLAHGGAERNFDFWMLNVELLRLAAMWNWPMMNFDALTRCFEHEIFEHGCHHEFFWTRITRMTRIFFGTRISPISRIFVRGGALTWGTNRTNIFISHTDLTDHTDLCSQRGAHSSLNTRFAVGPLTEGR